MNEEKKSKLKISIRDLWMHKNNPNNYSISHTVRKLSRNKFKQQSIKKSNKYRTRSWSK